MLLDRMSPVYPRACGGTPNDINDEYSVIRQFESEES